MKTNYGIRGTVVLFTLLATGSATADDAARATYLANEGVLVTRGSVKVLFDPLFDNGFGQYQLLPADMAAALMAGRAPFDGIDAVFVSHHHGDHFAPSMMLDYLRAQTDVMLYAPLQAVTGMRRASGPGDAGLFDRVVGLDLDVGDDPTRLEAGGLAIEAVRVPHSGWPNRMTDVENIVFRVTLDDAVTVAHFGDADPTIGHFRPQAAYWEERDVSLALPPYWFFLSDDGEETLDTVIRPTDAIGVHVPASMPDDPAARPAEIQGYDLFTEPGETRTLVE